MVTRKSIVWQIFPPYIFLILISLLIVTLYATDALKHLYLQRIRTDLEARGHLISQLLQHKIDVSRIDEINHQIHDLSGKLNIRITVILPDGRVIADSDENYEWMENHADRPEIREAYGNHTGSSVRHSYTLHLDMLYVAVPVMHDNQIVAVVRTSMPASNLSETLREIYGKIAWTAILVVFVAGMIGFIYTTFLNKPIQAIQKGAARIGGGELDHRIYISRPEELKKLADSMNTMAGQLEERIDIITKQRNELEAILTSMVEAVLVVNTDEQIIRMNDAMSQLFKIDPEEVMGKNLQTVIRNIGLQRFIRKTLGSHEPQEEEFIIMAECECTVQAHGTLLLDAGGQAIGGLIVLNDITRPKALENIRREFVANVSHELKTPITAIHGFVETLREGALDDRHKAHEFLDIIMKHTDRLNTIIEDLLNLSRIERDYEKGEIRLEKSSIREILKEAISLCQNKASEKKIELTLTADSKIKTNINGPLLTQAIVNLIDNAIKYSPEKSRVSVRAIEKPGQVLIHVEDNGIGIPQTDIPRIFERFYRVDKARSRQLGGTGLGLSIAKHIVQAHGGTVSVESQLEEGSLFTLILPMK